MRYFVTPGCSLSGTIRIPPSKSQTHRALIFALLAEGTSTIERYLDSPDTQQMIEAIRLLGASVEKVGPTLEVKGTGGRITPARDVISAGNSGIVLRFLGAIASLGTTYTVITGDQSIRTLRPVQPLLDALTQLGVFAESSKGDGMAPIIIRGPMTGDSCELDGQDSQPVSGLLIAAAFTQDPGVTEIVVKNPGEKPWIDVTLSWFDRFGIPYKNDDYARYCIAGGASLGGFTYTVPGDFSSLLFPVAAALVTKSQITIENVDIHDMQGDKKVLSFLAEMGANIEARETSIQVRKTVGLQGKRFDVNDTIDAVPILAVIGCFAEGTTELTNGIISRRKECDRIHCIATELQRMGADIAETPDGLVIRKSVLSGTSLQTYNDHRMAMSLVVAAMGATGPSVVDGVACISKTYPTFLEDMNILGAGIDCG